MTKWTVDASHSSVGFSVKHMMVSKVKGVFEEYTATIDTEDLTDLSNTSITFEIQIASI